MDKCQLLPNYVVSGIMELENPKEATSLQTIIARLQEYFMERLNQVEIFVAKKTEVLLFVFK